MDKNGKQLLTKNGNPKQRKIWLVDWDKPGKVEEWRHAWAEEVNSLFQAKGMPERISEKSYEEQGIERHQPSTKDTIVKPKKEKHLTKQLRSKTELKSNIKITKKKINNQKHFDALSQHFSFNEKRLVKELSHELRNLCQLREFR